MSLRSKYHKENTKFRLHSVATDLIEANLNTVSSVVFFFCLLFPPRNFAFYIAFSLPGQVEQEVLVYEIRFAFK